MSQYEKPAINSIGNGILCGFLLFFGIIFLIAIALA